MPFYNAVLHPFFSFSLSLLFMDTIHHFDIPMNTTAVEAAIDVGAGVDLALVLTLVLVLMLGWEWA